MWLSRCTQSHTAQYSSHVWLCPFTLKVNCETTLLLVTPATLRLPCRHRSWGHLCGALQVLNMSIPGRLAPDWQVVAVEGWGLSSLGAGRLERKVGGEEEGREEPAGTRGPFSATVALAAAGIGLSQT